jgi:enoyl-CoA hydratase
MQVITKNIDSVAVISINRPESRNAVDRETAGQLVHAFYKFSADDALKVAVLTGDGGTFCSGADLKAFAGGQSNWVDEEGEGPMGPTRMKLHKPVIAAIEGHAVAGGLELAIWCDLRVAAKDAIFGVFSRRFGVPLIDLGTIRLPRLIGQSRAMDLILTGRSVSAEEAMQIGLVNRLTEPGNALNAAIELAKELAAFPQLCMRNDRLSVYEQWDLKYEDAIRNELRHGRLTLESGEAMAGAKLFSAGEGRKGKSV